MEYGTFGPRLRYCRLAAGMSLAGLAAAVHYSKSYLSKVESGKQAPSAALARRCDSVLGTRGQFIGLLAARPVEPAAVIEGDLPGDEWRLRLLPDGSGEFTADRADLITLAAAAATVEPDCRSLRSLLTTTRLLGRATSPSIILPVVLSQLHVVRTLLSRTGPDFRRDLLDLGAELTESIGWLAQETGDHRTGLRWTEHAASWARAAGNDDLVDHTSLRRSLMLLYRGDAGQAIAVSERLRARPEVLVRTRWLAAHRSAQAYALTGDHARCFASIDAAHELEHQLAATAEGERLEFTARTAVATGWCCYDLGLVDKAAEILDREVPMVARDSARARARFGTRRALAHVGTGGVDQACQILWDVMDDIERVDSATIRLDLRLFARQVGRHQRRPAVAELQPRLSAALLGQGYA
jgi:transcriptional regulator with XRE-family HTH domain